MVIDKIGNINNISETRKSKPVSGKKDVEKSDSIQISNEGKQAAEIARHSQIIRESSDIRLERVKELKQRIQEGSYDFNDNKMLEMVANKIADSLLR